jgi:anti-sigma B factor antagonist
MHLETQDTILVVSGIQELTAVNATETKTNIKEALKEIHTRIDVDLSSTSFIDSSGLGVLIGLHKAMATKNGSIRIVNPTDSVQQVLELTRLHRLFEIVNS